MINGTIKIAGILFILLSLIRIPLVIFYHQWFSKIGVDAIVIEFIVGYFLIARAYWARIFGLILSGGGAFAYWTYASLYVDQAPRLICQSHSFFYMSFFVFFLLPPVKRAFGPPPYLKKIGGLTVEEIKKITNQVRLVVVFIMLHGCSMIVLSGWLSRHGFPAEDASAILIIEIIVAIGLLLRRRIVGRVFGLLLSFTFIVGYIAVSFLEPTAIQGVVGVTVQLCTVLFFTGLFFSWPIRVRRLISTVPLSEVELLPTGVSSLTQTFHRWMGMIG